MGKMFVGPTEVVSPLLGVCQVTHLHQETPVLLQVLKQLIQRVMADAMTESNDVSHFLPISPILPISPKPPTLPVKDK